MKIAYSDSINSKSDILICPYFEDKKYGAKIKKHLNTKLFEGKSGETLLLPNEKLLFVGLGKKSKIESADVRSAFAKAAKHLLNEKYNKIDFNWDDSLEEYIQEIFEGILLINHFVGKYKTGKDLKKEKEKLFGELTIVGKNLKKDFKKKIKNVASVVEAVHYVRDLVTGPPNSVNVDYFADEVKKTAKKSGFTAKIYDKAWLKKNKMGAILGVNSGCTNGAAKLAVLEYKPKGAAKTDPILLVGKGLIFDSGGYNLKPTKHIEDMQQDMAGGALVLGIFKVLKQLDVKKRIVGVIPLTENLIDGDSMRPSDVLTAHNGKTIEIRNTDAEGRLILADAISYGVKTFKPKYTIDFATLTGACVVALGDRYAGVMGNNKELINKLIDSGNSTDELLWQLPLHKDFSEAMKGTIADLRNVDNGTSYMAGASKAAAFIENFVEKSNWAHIDIAGTAYVKKPKAHENQHGTGYGLRLMLDFLRNI